MNGRRGRPVKSSIRRNIVNILYVLGEATGYDIYKVYIKFFGKVTLRSIYYNLHKGVLLDLFVLKETKRELGDYSWGSSAEKIYYSIGKKAKISLSDEELESLKRTIKNMNLK